MELKRKPFLGTFNIIRFNWHFYLIAGLFLASLLFVNNYLPKQVQFFTFWSSVFAILAIIVSLLISYWIYDLSDLYHLKWIPESNNKIILNISAGFDETSGIIKNKYPKTELTICDFYNPKKHTEVSIKRARLAYPPISNTIQVSTNKLPFQDNYFDCSLAILSAHEIRDEKERIDFFTELNRVTKSNGQILVTEHLRDFSNFIAYTVGFFHFHSKSTWFRTFEQANLSVKKEIKTTPFITTFILEKNADPF